VIFVDTSFFVALNAARDAHHDDAVTLLRRHGDDSLLTSNHVLGESWTFMRRRYGHAVARRTCDRIRRSPRIEVQHVTEPMEMDAWRLLDRQSDREISFVDATSFVMMRSTRSRQVLTFDGDFAAAGFVELHP
jgi:predicted nucleic acid-binding protein